MKIIKAIQISFLALIAFLGILILLPLMILDFLIFGKRWSELERYFGKRIDYTKKGGELWDEIYEPHTSSKYTRIFRIIKGVKRPKEFDQLFQKKGKWLGNSYNNRWVLDFKNGIILYDIVKKHGLKHALDLGTGIGVSSALLALGGAKVTTIEQYHKCIDLAKKLVSEPLQKKITFIHSNAFAFQEPKISKYQWFAGYKDLPHGLFDIVVIDGPAPWLENKEFVTLPCGDILRLMDNIVPNGKVFIDGRKPTVNLIKRYLTKYLTLIEVKKNCYIFERTDEPWGEVEDLVAEEKRQLGFFTQ